MHPAVIDVPSRAVATDLLSRAYRGQPVLSTTAVLFLLAMAPTAVALGVDGRTLNGVSVWIKPLKFQFSLAVHLLTVAGLMLFLPADQRQRRLVRTLVAIMTAAALFEIGYITLQASRGAASHFNETTVPARMLYALMGIGAVSILVASGWIGALILRHGRKADPVVLAAGVGLVLGALLGGVTGTALSGHGGHWVGDVVTDVGGLPLFGWSRDGGDLRVAHFAGMHLTQALPIAAWIATRRLPPRLHRPTITAVAVAGTIVTAVLFLQALRGRPLV